MTLDATLTHWLRDHRAELVRDLASLVAIRSISTDGQHQKEIDSTAELTCEQMKRSGLQNVAVLKTSKSNPYAYGEWLGAPGKPTVFLYAHHDVQPVNFEADWKSPPWKLTERDGRFYGRGAADDKGAIVVQLGAIAAFLKTQGSLPVNVKMLVEGEEEVGSCNLLSFFQEHQKRIASDVIVVCDTENVETGWPSITYSLRGIVAATVEVRAAELPVHSGVAGGALADAAVALNVILSRLYWKNGKIATTDDPYMETKEQLGGISILEARDLNHAVQLVSELPGFKYGLRPIEIRPAADLDEMTKASEQRRRQIASR